MFSRLSELGIQLAVFAAVVMMVVGSGMLLRSCELMTRRFVSGHDSSQGWRNGLSLGGGCNAIVMDR